MKALRILTRGKKRQSQAGFAVAPILYLLAMAGVAAGVLFSGYSQILRANLNVTNATAAKGDLSGDATTLSATGVLSTDQAIFCPPRGANASAACAEAPQKLIDFASAESSRLPSDVSVASSSGSPQEVGVFAAGAGVKQLDPWGRYYVYCRWENSRFSLDAPAMAVITGGANGKVETGCGDSAPSGDDQMTTMTVGESVNRASVWQQDEDSTEASFGAPGSKVTVTADGVIQAVGLILSGTATFSGLTSPLPIGSGGTGASTIVGARSNLGSGAVGDALFTAITASGARSVLGATAAGDYLFSSSALIAETASAVRLTLLGAGTTGNDVFLAATPAAARAVLGSTSLGDYLFSSSTTNATLAGQARLTLLNAGSVGDAVFVASTSDIALTALGGTDVGKAVFMASSESGARTSLGSGAEGSLLFTATSQLHAWEILGLTGTLNPSLNISVSGSAATVDASGITGGAVPIVHGGTSATTATDALDNLFAGDTSAPGATIKATRFGANTISSSKLTDVVAEGTYNLVTVDTAGRVVAGSYTPIATDELTDGDGTGIVATATGGGYLYFSTAGSIKMTLSPLGYLGIGITDPEEKLHVYDGNVRISGAAETTRELQFATGTSNQRWIVAANATAESGSDAGSDFIINRVTDGGVESNALIIDRSSGTVSAPSGFLGYFTGTFSGVMTGGTLLGSSSTLTSPYRNGDQTTGLYSDAAYTVSIATAGIERLRVTNSGVGVGVSSPEYPLDVGDKGARAGLLHFTGTTTSAGVFDGTATGTTGAVQYNDGTGHPAGDSNLVWISGDVYLGIGTDTPRAALDMGYTAGGLILPTGTSGERPSNIVGTIRYNSELNGFEGYQGATPSWGTLGGGATSIYLGSSVSVANPRRSDSVSTGFYSDASEMVAVTIAGTEVMRVTATGSVGIGGIAPSYPLQVGSTSANGAGAFLAPAGVWTNASDRRLKEKIRPLSYGLDDLMKLKPVAYEMKGTGEKQIGFIAQDVAEVLPEVVSISQAGRYGLSYGNMVAVTVQSIQELNRKIEGFAAERTENINKGLWLLVAVLGVVNGLALLVLFFLQRKVVLLEERLRSLSKEKGGTC